MPHILKIRETIVVEGNYDKIKLSSIVDAAILTTGGFSVFKDKEKLSLLRTMARKNGLIILTDPDGAGFKIRNYIKQGLPAESVKHAYIPDISGKERRKANASKEGKLGVEGVDAELIIAALRNAGATILDGDGGEGAGGAHPQPPQRQITKLDFYHDGLTGGSGSAAKRRKLAAALGLPARISANMLAEIINIVTDYDSYAAIVRELD